MSPGLRPIVSYWFMVSIYIYGVELVFFGCYDYQIKKDEVGVTCSMRGRMGSRIIFSRK